MLSGKNGGAGEAEGAAAVGPESAPDRPKAKGKGKPKKKHGGGRPFQEKAADLAVGSAKARTTHEDVGRPPTHGLSALYATVTELGGRGLKLLDENTPIGMALAEWRRDLIADLGGPDAVSTMQRAVIDTAVKTKLLLDSIDAWLLSQRAVVNKSKRTVFPVIESRQRIADSFARNMALLGFHKRSPAAKRSLQAYIASRYGPDGKLAPQANADPPGGS